MTITHPTEQDFDYDRPYLIGLGPAIFSTCTDLVPTAQYVADVNGYYRALGVHPKATRKELREAYDRLDGQNSPYLTYVFKQLLDPDVRASYDRRPLGPPMSDLFVVEAFRRTIRQNASAEQLERINDFEEWLLAKSETPEPDSLQASLDDPSHDVHDEGASPDTGNYLYAHYLYRSTASTTEHLPRWQSLVIQACRSQGIEVSLALGFHHAAEHPWLVQQVGYSLVLFFHEGRTPDAIYADDAVRYIAALLRKTHDNNPDLHRRSQR